MLTKRELDVLATHNGKHVVDKIIETENIFYGSSLPVVINNVLMTTDSKALRTQVMTSYKECVYKKGMDKMELFIDPEKLSKALKGLNTLADIKLDLRDSNIEGKKFRDMQAELMLSIILGKELHPEGVE